MVTYNRLGARKWIAVALAAFVVSAGFFLPAAAAASGLDVVTDPSGDNVNGGGGASDIVRVGGLSDDSELHLFVGVAGADHPKLIQFHVQFALPAGTYEAYTSYATDGSFSSSFVNPVGNAGAARAIGVAWVDGELKMSIDRTDVGSPADGEYATDVTARTRHGASGSDFDSTAAGEYRIGNNFVPVLAALGPQSVDEHATLNLTVNATDGDGDALTYTAAPLPEGATFNASTRLFSWTPGIYQSGAYEVTFSVTDGDSEDNETVVITVVDTNQAPVLASIGARNVTEGDLLTFTLEATDGDGEALTYAASGLPTGANFDAGLATFSWTPSTRQAGTYRVTFNVTDGFAVDAETVTIKVHEVAAPVLGAVGNRTVLEGQPLAFALSATDADGDDLTYSAAGLPAGAALNASSGAFSWTPAYNQVGDHAVTFRVSDGSLFDNESVTLRVLDDNSAPVIEPIGARNVTEGNLLEFQVVVFEPDGETFNLTASGVPAGASFDEASGKFSWTPAYNRSGEHVVTFMATDGTLSDTEVVTLTVIDVVPNLTLASSDPATVETSPGVKHTFRYTVTNHANGKDVFTISAPGPAGWAATVSPTTFTLSPGQSRTVTLAVTAAGGVPEGSVTLSVSTAAGGAKDASVTLELPVFLSVEMDKTTYLVGEAVTGSATVTYKNGAPAADLEVRLRERSDIGFTRLVDVETGADGTVAFELPSTIIASGQPGAHTVESEVVSWSNTASKDFDSYDVSLL